MTGLLGSSVPKALILGMWHWHPPDPLGRNTHRSPTLVEVLCEPRQAPGEQGDRRWCLPAGEADPRPQPASPPRAHTAPAAQEPPDRSPGPNPTAGLCRPPRSGGTCLSLDSLPGPLEPCLSTPCSEDRKTGGRPRRRIDGGGSCPRARQAPLEPAGRNSGGAQALHPCLWELELLCWEGLRHTPNPRQEAPEVRQAPCGIRRLSVKQSLGPTGSPCPTWWSPAFHNLTLTHVDPAPHLASIWGLHSWGLEEVTSGWRNQGSPGGQ